jgi:hypothetical protein
VLFGLVWCHFAPFGPKKMKKFLMRRPAPPRARSIAGLLKPT